MLDCAPPFSRVPPACVSTPVPTYPKQSYQALSENLLLEIDFLHFRAGAKAPTGSFVA
jgi:hypothetical protein